MSDESKSPSIDERIQALTHSLELLAAMHRDLEKLIAARFTETLGFINQLAPVADAHEQCVHRLEDRE